MVKQNVIPINGTPIDNPADPQSMQKHDTLKPNTTGGGEPPMDGAKKYATKRQLKRKVKRIDSRFDELDKSIDSKITKAKLQAVIWLIGTTIAGVAAVGWIFSLIMNSIK